MHQTVVILLNIVVIHPYAAHHTLDMASDTDDYIILAAIDFGTTYSGYAYTFKGNSNIFINSNWTSKGTLHIYIVNYYYDKS